MPWQAAQTPDLPCPAFASPGFTAAFAATVGAISVWPGFGEPSGWLVGAAVGVPVV